MRQPSNNTVQAFWVGMGSLSSFALAIVSASVLSRYFDKAEYGTYRQILYVYNTLLVIFAAGLPKVFSYYLPRYSLQFGKDLVRKIGRLLFLMGFFFSIVLFCFSGVFAAVLKNPELELGLKWFSPIPMLLLPTLGIEGIFSTYKKTIYIAIYNTLTRLLMLLFIVLPVVLFNGTYLYAIYGWLVASILSLLFAYYLKGIPFKGVAAQKIDLTYKEVFSYSLPILVASLAGIAINSADHFFISRYFGAEVFAEYSNGFIQLPFVGMVTVATSTVLFPEFSRLLHGSGNSSKVVELWSSALAKSAILIYPLVVFFIAYANPVIECLFSSAYENSVIYFRIAMLLNFFNIIIFAPLLLASGKVRFYRNVHVIIALLVWAGEYAVVLMIRSPLAVAIVSVSLGIVKILVLTWFSARLINFNLLTFIPIKNIGMPLVHSVIVIAVIKIFSDIFLSQFSHLPILMICFAFFLLLLLCTAKFFRLDYVVVIQPICKKFMSKSRKAS